MAVVEYAKSARSKCNGCGWRISADALRFRVDRKWRCVECFALTCRKKTDERTKGTDPEDCKERNAKDCRDCRDCKGAEALCPEDRLLLCELKRKLPADLWLRAEEHRAVRQCRRAWQVAEAAQAAQAAKAPAEAAGPRN